MADEPNTRMDEKLKAYADKRRQEAGAPFDLHPATRRMLQGEVARTYKHAPQAGWLRRVILYWPRIAFAAACVAITITLMLIVLPRQQVMEMAKAPPAPAAEPATATRDVRLSDREEAQKLVEGFADKPVPAAPAPLALPPASSTAPMQPSRSLDRFAKQVEADESKAKSELMAEQRKDTDALKALPEKSVVINEVARRAVYANKPDTVRARYMQQNNAPAPQLGVRLQKEQQQQAQVLNTFEFEQVGDTVRVIDGDGSVYVGNMLSESDVKKRGYVVQERAAVAGTASGPATDTQLMFYAIGTNITLRQKVSIEANIMQLQTNIIATSGAAAPAQLPAKNERAAGQNAGEFVGQNARQNAVQNAIRGRARVGTNQEVPIDAISIKP